MVGLGYPSSLKKSYNFTVVDTETTGLDARTSSLIEIGAVEMLIATFKLNRKEFSMLSAARLGADISEKALEVNGRSIESVLQNDVSFEQLTKLFLKWHYKLGAKNVAGENVGFDLSFVNSAFEQIGSGY